MAEENTRIVRIGEFVGQRDVEIIPLYKVTKKKNPKEQEETVSWHLEKDTALISLEANSSLEVQDTFGIALVTEGVGRVIFPLQTTVAIEIANAGEIRTKAREKALAKLNTAERLALGLLE